jgi:hypothetical protein
MSKVVSAAQHLTAQEGILHGNIHAALAELLQAVEEHDAGQPGEDCNSTLVRSIPT